MTRPTYVFGRGGVSSSVPGCGQEQEHSQAYRDMDRRLHA